MEFDKTAFGNGDELLRKHIDSKVRGREVLVIGAGRARLEVRRSAERNRRKCRNVRTRPDRDYAGSAGWLSRTITRLSVLRYRRLLYAPDDVGPAGGISQDRGEADLVRRFSRPSQDMARTSDRSARRCSLVVDRL